MRGKLGRYAESARDYGITPAYAGKTRTDDGSPMQAQDHPRGCGENPCICLTIGLLSGSPPRMRGKRLHINVPVLTIGITPADAGKTFRR